MKAADAALTGRRGTVAAGRTAFLIAGTACALALLTAGCATLGSRPLPSAAAQEALLRGMSDFALHGRVGVRAGDEGLNVPTLTWTQRGPEASVYLAGPFGAGNLQITWTPDALRIAKGDEVLEGALAEQVLIDNLGFVPPFAALRYWVLGLVAPGEAPVEQGTGDNGRLQTLVQQQWRIRYDSWVRAALNGEAVELPGRLVATRDDLRLTVVVRRWRP